MTESKRPLLTVLGQLRAGRPALVAALLGALAENGGAIVAGAATGWLAGAAAVGRPVGELYPAVAVVIVAVLVSAIGNWALGQFGHAFAFRSQAELRLKLFDALHRAAPREMHGRRTGDMASVVMGDVDALEGFFAHLGIGASVAALTGAASVGALAAIDPVLVPIAVVGMLAAAVAPTWLARLGKRRARRLREEVGAVNADVVDGVQGLRELLVFGHTGPWYRRIASGTERLRRYRLAHAHATGLQDAVTEALVAVTTVAVLVAVLGLVSAGRLDLPAGALALTLVIAALTPVTAAVGMAGTLAPLRASARRVLELLSLVDGSHGDGGVPGVARPRGGAVRFEGVSFGYPGRDDVLRGVDFEIPAGQTVALVGSSGAGKTTCVNLLLRFWDPDSGRITVDGTDLRELPADQVHKVVTVVPQEVYLFAGTVASNLRLARPDATDAELERAAVAAAAHGFISELPGGYDTPVGERGALLSGGQRQRLTIARALLADTPILVLDEAASNLDAENERVVQRALRAARQGRTTLIVAHRLSTIRAADRIVVLDGGRVVETGTHDELLTRGGDYAELITHQTDEAARV
ncbi:ABC transporter ATP-binding protein [Pseudonocardia acaciae]|uniref:ABC transporter ATP-binding protein n=1 Tax=Pseudonocardia acaciae TaxID=551276 RepID=UPI00068745B2|nr:ABC transporter ATP-binding protein [Pseudonocardia acaciae]